MKLPRDIVDTLVVAEDTLRDCLANFSDKTFHIKVFENAANNGMCEQIGSGQWEHQSRCDIRQGLVEIGRILENLIGALFVPNKDDDLLNNH